MGGDNRYNLTMHKHPSSIYNHHCQINKSVVLFVQLYCLHSHLHTSNKKQAFRFCSETKQLIFFSAFLLGR